MGVTVDESRIPFGDDENVLKLMWLHNSHLKNIDLCTKWASVLICGIIPAVVV